MSPPKTADPLRILVAEDREDNRQALCMHLIKLGQSIAGEASTGEEVIPLIENLGRENVDVLFMDVSMPPGQHGGITIGKEVYERWFIPSILYTGHDEPELVEAWSQEPYILGYIKKPASTADIQFALASARRERMKRREYGTIFAAMAYVAKRTDSTMWEAYERLYQGAKSERVTIFTFSQETLETLRKTYRKLGYK